MARFVLPSPLFLAKSMRTVSKKMGFHSILGIFEYRGTAERPIFGRFSNHCKRRFFHGPVFLLLLGYALGPLALQPTALAQGYDNTDRAMLTRIEADVNKGVWTFLQPISYDVSTSRSTLGFIQNDTGNLRTDFAQFLNYDIPIIESNLQGISNLVAKIAKAVSNQVDLTQIEQDLEDSLTELKQLNNNMGYLAEGTALENSDGQGFDNLISGINYGSRSMSMADSLQLIGQAVGGLGTSFGPHTQDNATLPLIRTILGWSSGYASNNIQTNGIIGLLQSINREVVKLHTMTNPIISSIEKQTTAITNQLHKFEKVFADMANTQTNILFMQTLASQNETIDLYEFLGYLRENDLTTYIKGNTGSYLYLLPYWLVPYENGTRQIQQMYGSDYDWFPSTDGDLEGLTGEFYKYYGNLRSYNHVFGDEAGDIEETREGASNLVAESTMKTTNVVVKLISEISVNDLRSPWNDYSSKESEMKALRGPSKEDYDRVKGYYEESMEESEESASFKFDLVFSEGAEIHIEEVDLLPDDSVIGGIPQKANQLIKFGCSTIKGILLLVFTWQMLDMAFAVMNGNAVVG